jgi:hypothetical protein
MPICPLQPNLRDIHLDNLNHVLRAKRPMKKKKDPWLVAHWKAEKILPKLVLVEVPHYLTAARDGLNGYEGFKSYEVRLGKNVLGRVENVREHMCRKTGRLITRSWYRKAWQYQAYGLDSSGIYYLSRKRTVYELVYHLVLQHRLGGKGKENASV